MAVIRWLKSQKNGDDEWESVYVKELLNRLRRDKNLSDIANRAAARGNLDLIGEVNDHWHDTRYLPKIDEVTGKVTKLREDITKMIDDGLKPLQSTVNTHTTEINNLKGRCTNLENRCATIENSIKDINTKIAAIQNKIDKIFDENGRLVFPNTNRLWVE